MGQAAHSVLVVEDEPLVRLVAADIIEELGIIPYEAGDADEALFQLAAHPDIDVLFTDVDMPGGMDGIALAERVHQFRPEIGIIVTSGKMHVPEASLPDQGTFLPKPYRPEQLAGVVEQKLLRA
jgi:two-component system, response regulator PdtaR